jgi:hypothetical protein
MAKSATLTLKGTANAVVKAAEKALSAFDLGNAMAAIGFSAQDIALQVIALLGASVYVEGTAEGSGLPKWGKLPAALKAADHKVSRNEFAMGMAARWDKRYITSALCDAAKDPILHAEQVKYRALCKAAGVKGAEMFCSLTPAAKGKLGEGSDVKAAAVQDLSDTLNKAFSYYWSAIKAADDKRNGRNKKGAPTERSLTEKLLRGSLESLPAAVAKAVEEGFEVEEDLKQIAAIILRHRGWAKVKAEA